MRRTTARVLLFIGGLAAAVSWWAFAAEETVFNPGATHDVAARLLFTGPVQDSAVRSLATQVRKGLPAGTNPDVATSIARQAVADPELHEAFGEAARTLHEQVLSRSGTHRELVVDTAAVNAALRSALAHVDPKLAARFKPSRVSMRFDTRNLPDLARARTAAPTTRLFGLLVALLAWTLAVVVHPDRSTAVRSIGRRLAGIGLVPVTMWVVLPAALRALDSHIADGIAPFATGYGRHLVPPAIVLSVAGVGIWLAARCTGPIRRRLAVRRGEALTPGVVLPMPLRPRHAPLRPRQAAASGDGVDLML